MSTSLKTIKGRREVRNSPVSKLKFEDTTLHVNRFHGGKKGPMIQLTLSSEGYIQLTEKKVKELYKVLKHAFNYTKYPSE